MISALVSDTLMAKHSTSSRSRAHTMEPIGLPMVKSTAEFVTWSAATSVSDITDQSVTWFVLRNKGKLSLNTNY